MTTPGSVPVARIVASLAAAIGPHDSEFDVLEPAGESRSTGVDFPDADFYVRLDDGTFPELIHVGTRAGNHFSDLTRGVDSDDPHGGHRFNYACDVVLVVPGTSVGGSSMPVLASVPPDVSQIPLGQARIYATNDQFNGITVRVRSHGARAGYAGGGVAYVDKTGFSSDGAGTTVEHLVPEEENAHLVVDVVDRAITVTLATSGDAVPASGGVGDDDSELTFTAKTPGAAGNNVEVDLGAPGTDAVAETSAVRDGTEIDVTLAQTAGPADDVAPTLTTTLGAANKDLVWENGYQGNADGNGSTFSYVLDSGASAHSVVADSDLAYPNVGLKFGPSATAQDVLDYYADHEDYTIRPTGLASGSSGAGAIAAGTWTFAGGQTSGGAGTVTATAADVKAAIEADTDANALVAVGLAAGDGSGIAPSGVSAGLSGGVDAGQATSSAADVVAAIEANPPANTLVAAQATDDGAASGTEGPQPLTGGDPNALIDATIWSND